MTNIDVYRGNRLSADDVAALEIPHIICATGSSWRRDGVGRQHAFPIKGLDEVDVLTPDDIFAGAEPGQAVLIYDDDHYYLGSALAEYCTQQGRQVCLLTPDSRVSSWTEYTLEQEKIESRLSSLGVDSITMHELQSVTENNAVIRCVYDAGKLRRLNFDSLVLITSRQPDHSLYHRLMEHQAKFKTLLAIGDCEAPSTVAAAVYAGHLAARNLQSEEDIYEPLFRREMPGLD